MISLVELASTTVMPREAGLAYTPAQFDLQLKLALDVFIEPTYQGDHMLAG